MKKILSFSVVLCVALTIFTGFANAHESVTELSWWIAGPGWAVDEGYQNDPVTKELEAKTNTHLNIHCTEDDAIFAAMLATGDLPDMMVVDPLRYGHLIEAGYLLPLNDLLESDGTDILVWTDMIASAKKRFADADGNLYGIEGYIKDPEQISVNGYPYGLTLRWDYYAEMGYPEVKTYDDLLQVMSDMVAKYPTNAEGEKRYGMSMFSDWGWLTFFGVLGVDIATLEGVPTVSIRSCVAEAGGFIQYWLDTEEITDIISDENSSSWKAIDFLNKAYKMDLLDPDSWINTYDAVNQKCTADRILFDIWNWNYGGINNALRVEESADENVSAGKGYMPLLSTSGQQYVFTGQVQHGLTGFSQRVFVITTSCKNPEAAMRFYNYLYTYEGSRLIHAGVEGTHYIKQEDGTYLIPEQVTLDRLSNANFSQVTGIGKYSNSVGLGQVVDPACGQHVQLSQDSDTEYIEKYSQLERDWFNYNGFNEYSDFGNTINRTGSVRADYVANLAPVPDDIKEIDANVSNYLSVELPNMIRITDEDEFAAKKAEVIAECKALGSDTAFEWHLQQWNDSKALSNAD